MAVYQVGDIADNAAGESLIFTGLEWVPLRSAGNGSGGTKVNSGRGQLDVEPRFLSPQETDSPVPQGLPAPVAPRPQFEPWDRDSRRGVVGESSPYFDTMMQVMQNTPASAMRFAKDMGHAVISPKETLEGVGNVLGGYAEKAVNRLTNTKAGDAPTAFHRFMGIAPGDYEHYADSVNQYYADKYGSWDKFIHSLETDPVGVAGDFSAVLGPANLFTRLPGAAGRLAGTTAAVGSAIDPLAATARGTGAIINKTRIPRVAGLVRNTLAESSYGSILDPGKTHTKADIAALARVGLEEGIIPNNAGMAKLNARIDSLSKELDDLVASRTLLEEAGEAAKNIDPNYVAQVALDDALRVHGNTVNPRAGRAAVDASTYEFVDVHGRQGPLSTGTAHELKKNTELALGSSHAGVSSPRADAQKALSRSLGEHVEQNVPAARPLNRRINKLHNLQDNFIKNSSKNSDSARLGTVAGAATATSPTALGARLLSAGLLPTNIARFGVGLHNLDVHRLGNATNGVLYPLRYGRLYESSRPNPQSLGLLQMLGEGE